VLRLLCTSFLVPVLAMLLALTTPVGTGDGVHQDQLLHPIFPHTHLIDGRIVSDQQLAAAQTAAARLAEVKPRTARHAPAVGAGSAAEALGVGLALSTTVPIVELRVIAPPGARLLQAELISPAEFREVPQDPPPHRIT